MNQRVENTERAESGIARRIVTTIAIAAAAIWIASSATAQQPAAPAAEAPAAAAAAAAAVDQTPLPSVDEVFARSIEARGGEASLRRHQHMTSKGTFSMPGMGLEGTITIKASAPNLSFITIEAPGIGTIAQGYDGKVGWSDNPMTGPTLNGERELELTELQSDMHADLDPKKHFSKIEMVGREDYAGEPCYKVSLTTPGGVQMFNYYSVATGLQVGSSGNMPTPMGDAFVEIEVGGYKEFDGNLYPTVTKQKAMGAEQILTVTELDFSPIDASVYALPEAVKTLVAAQPAK